MGIFKYFVALDTPNCSEGDWREIPNEQIKRIKLGIINVKNCVMDAMKSRSR